jgi:predicted CXXCH cytochrome family protein
MVVGQAPQPTRRIVARYSEWYREVAKLRRWLIALATAMVAAALWAGAAYADDSIYHGNYNTQNATTGLWSGPSTTRCAGCHRAHTATGPALLKASTSYALCTSCHGTANGLDVVDGVEWPTDRTTHQPLLGGMPTGGNKGGGFVQSFMNKNLQQPPTNPTNGWQPTPNGGTNPVVLQASTSAHKVNGMPGYTSDTAWGFGAIGSGVGLTGVTLECTSCHDPHGGAGGLDATGKRIPTYRILRANPPAEIGATGAPVVVPEDAAASHEFLVDSHLATDNTKGSYYGQEYLLTGLNETQSMQVLSAWCATCHTRIHTSSSDNSGDAIYQYRHVTNGGSVENNLGQTVPGTVTPAGPSSAPGCLTCHTAHGSSVAATGQAGSVLKPGAVAVAPGQTQPATDFLDSSLLRLDNRGVCEVCHNK